MTIDLYYSKKSASCRAVYLLAKKIGIDINIKHVNIQNGDNTTPEFLKMNPEHTIPTIDDNGFYLSESHAILKYLATDDVYPADKQKRAIVDHRLFFDVKLSKRFADAYNPIFLNNCDFIPDRMEKLENAMEFLNIFLNDQPYVAGSDLSIADFSIVATISNMEAVDFPITNYPNVQRWYEKMHKELPDYGIIEEGVREVEAIYPRKISRCSQYSQY